MTSLADYGDVLTVAEAAGALRIGRTAMYEAVRKGEIPGVIKVGRAIRISRFQLERMLGLETHNAPARDTGALKKELPDDHPEGHQRS